MRLVNDKHGRLHPIQRRQHSFCHHAFWRHVEEFGLTRFETLPGLDILIPAPTGMDRHGFHAIRRKSGDLVIHQGGQR